MALNRGRLAVVAAALAAALGLAGAAAAAEDEGLGRPLRAVRFVCDAWFDEAGMRALLPLTPGEPVTLADLERSRVVLERAQIFRDIAIETHVDGDETVVTIALKRRQVLTAVRVSGHDALGWREVHRTLRLRTGSFFDREALRAARTRLVERYRQAGYPHARVRSRVVRRPGAVEVDITISEGEPARVLAADITGTLGVPRPALEAEVYLMIGRPHTRDMVRRGERKLLAALREGGYFEADVDGRWVPAPERGGGVLAFDVDAGRRSVIELDGHSALSRRRLLGLMDLSTRLIITDGTWRELARRMTEAYQAAGYYRATVGVKMVGEQPRRIVFTIDEGRRYRVTALRFEGNHGLSAAQLEAQMNTLPARVVPWPRRGAFVREVFDEDLRRLWFYYREEGFAEAQIVDAPIAVDDASGDITVTVVVEEGARSIVVAAIPPALPPADGAAPALQVRAGRPLRPAQLEADQRTIAEVWRRQGYTEVAVEPEVTREAQDEIAATTVAWRVTPGPQRFVGEVIVQGNVETRNEIIAEQLPFRRGDPLDPEALQRGQDAVYQLGTYRSVQVQALSDEAVQPDVGVDVLPRPPGSFQWGVGYNTRDGFTATGETAYDNIGRRARRVSLRAQVSVLPEDVSSSQYLAVLGYREPRFLRSDWQWKVELLGERSTRAIDQYKIQRGSLGNGFTRALLPRLQGGGEVQVEFANVFDVEPLAFRDQDEGDSWTTALSPFLLYDGRDDPFAPTRGVLDTLRLRYALPGLSTVSFGKINLQHSQAVPIASWLAFVYTARIGYGRAFEGEEVLPIRERFFIGGATTVRGYSENSLGPTSPTREVDGVFLGDTVTGGDLAMILNLEGRVPVYGALSLAAFLDTGGLFLVQCSSACEQRAPLRNNGFSWSNFRKGAGPGLRYMTPVGPLSLDYGFKIDRRAGESLGAVHFSISGTF